jgi:membrane fusion protein (multidrug efflux system)
MTIEPREVLLTTELPARTAAFLTAEVRPQVGGIIQKRMFTEGADVKEGDLLYQIDPATYQAAFDNAQAALEAAARPPSAPVRHWRPARPAFEQAQAALELAVNNRKRLEPLLKERRHRLARIRPGRHRGKSGPGQPAIGQAQLKSDRQAVEQAEAAIEQAEAAAKTAQINLDYTQIKAPISGRIGRSSVTVGALVAAYQAMALATIQQLDPVYVDAPESTTELLKLRQRLSGGQLGGDTETLNKVNLILEDGMHYPMKAPCNSAT